MAKKAKKPAPGKEIFKGTDIGRQTDVRVPHLETSIDRLYHMVKQKKNISFLDAASEYGVDREQIAAWAHILEEHKLAKVHYPVFGSPEIFSIEEDRRKGSREEEGETEKPHAGKSPGKGPKKMMVALAGGLMVFAGYVMLVTNPFTITLRSQVSVSAGRLGLLFAFLPYPLNIIAPIIIIIAAACLVLVMRRRPGSHKARPIKEGRRQETPSGKEKESEKPAKEGKKEPKDLESKINKIKEELGY